MAAKRRCKAKAKAGKRCRAYPLSTGAYCSAHDPDRPASARFGSSEQAAVAGALGGRPASPRVVDVMRERVEAEMEAVLAPYFEAIREAVMFVKYEGELVVTDTPDLAGRIAAAEKLLDRVYGKPRQTIEHAGPESGAPLAVEFDLGESARKVLADALRARPASR
jgi:hypothetical protein